MNASRETFFRWIVARPWPVLVASVLVTGAAGVAASRVPIDYSFEQFFPRWGDERETYEEYRAHFSKEDTQFSLFWEDAREPGAALYAEMRRAAGLFEEAGLVDVRWFGNTATTGTAEIDGESAVRVHRLTDERNPTDEGVRSVLARQRADDVFRGFLWNADQSVFAVHGYLPAHAQSDVERRAIEERLTAALDGLGVADRPGLTTALVGVPVFRSRIPKLLERDQALFLGGGFLVFFVLLVYFFRDFGYAGLTLASVFPAYLCTVGLMGLTGRSVSILTSFIPIIILVVGVSDAIHLLTRHRRHRAETGDNDRAIVRTFSGLAGACFFTSATTAIGFLSLVGTRIDMVMEFGVFTAVAILLTYGFAMTTLPAVLAVYAPTRSVSEVRMPRWIEGVLARARRLPGTGRRWALVVGGAIAVVGLGVGATLRIDTKLVDDLKEESPVIQDLRWVESRGFGLFQVNVFLQGTASEELHRPEMLAWMAGFEDYVRAEPIVVGALGLPDILAELRRAVVDPEASGPPETVGEAAQLLLLAEFEGADAVGDVYRPDENVAQIVVTVRDEGSTAMLPFLARVDAFLADNPPPVGTAVSTGTVKLVQTFTEVLLRSFLPSFLLAVLLVYVLMAWMFRSLATGLVALVPNLLPLLVVLIFLKVAGVDLKPSTILVFSIAFGIAVDDTMHFLSHFRDGLRSGLAVEDAVRASIGETGPAILVTSVALGVGFSLLMASQFEVLYLVGLMTLVSIVAAVGADLFLLPSLLTARAGLEPEAELGAAAGAAAGTAAGAVAGAAAGPAGSVSENAPRKDWKGAAPGTLGIVCCLGLGIVGTAGTGAAPLAAQVQDPTERGMAIARAADERARGFHDFTANLSMVLRESGGRERSRNMRIRTLEGGGGETSTVVVFDEPRDLQGTAILTVTRPGEEGRQWLYLPAIRRVRRIATGDRDDSFMGSQFTYEDMGSEQLLQYRYRYLRQEDVDGMPALVVERFPLDDESAYARQVVWFDRGEYRVLRIDYHGPADRLLKTLRVEEYERYPGGHWRPGRMTMTDVASGDATLLLWSDYAFGTGLSEADFDPDRLGRIR